MDSYSTQQILANIQDYLVGINEILTPIGCLILAGFFLLLLVILKLKAPKTKKVVEVKKVAPKVVHQHIDAIAGDDPMTTQLDLARAYIEMGEISLAKQILKDVSKDGNATQQREAQQLIMGL
jgi:FimV-like protein